MASIDQYSNVILTVLAILAMLVPVYLKWIRPTWRGFHHDVVAGRDALVGREAILDPVSGTQLAPPLPGIGKRMETIETALVVLAETQIALLDHETRLKAIEEAAMERIVARAETGAAYSAIEAAYRSTPETDLNRDHREQREDRQDARADRDRARLDPHQPKDGTP